MPYYKGHKKYFLAVDCVVFGYEGETLKLLLYPRGFEPVKGRWSLIGGFVSANESCEEASARILGQITGLNNIVMEQVETFSQPDREESERVVSVVFYALIRIGEYDSELARSHNAVWFPIDCLPEMVFDHGLMVQKALARLQQKASYSLAGSGLLPGKFTLLQLRRLYEAIFQRTFDAGNFRKKILSLDQLERLEEKNITESRKGAYYYRLVEQPSKGENIRIVRFQD